MTARDVAAAAFDDQLGAAARDLVAEQLDVMARVGLASRYPRRATRRVLALFAAAVLADELVECEHLAGPPRRPAWAAADDAQHLRCTACLTAHLRRGGPLPGCDSCGQHDQLRAVAVVTSPITGAVVGGLPAPVPPVVLLGGLCAGCWSTSNEAPTGADTPASR